MNNRFFFRLLPLFCGAALLSACEVPGFLGALARDSSDLDPPGAPRVSSFARAGSILVSWDEDKRAENYILEAAPADSNSSTSDSWTVVYSGPSTSWEFRGAAENSFYRFRISKTWETKTFGPSVSAYGMLSMVSGDIYEPNDTEEQAVDLGCAKEANCYYYRSAGGLEIEDIDWYSIRIPPRMRAALVVTQLTNVDAANTVWFNFEQKGCLPENISNKALIYIPNYDYEEHIIKFRFVPRPEYFISGGGAGGSVVRYAVGLHDISAL